MNLESILVNSGLSEKEAKVYLTLLELDEAVASVIARITGLKRPTTYTVLESLIKKALVSTFVYEGIKYFKATNPDNLYTAQYENVVNLKKALPELKSIHEKYLTKPDMTLYEGFNGLKHIMEDTLTVSNKELLVWADPEIATQSVIGKYYPTYIERKVKKGIWVRGIVNDNPTSKEFVAKGKEELRKLKLVAKDKFPFENEINIYDDKVAIISHEDQIGVIIQNKAIADTQRSMFELCYSLL